MITFTVSTLIKKTNDIVVNALMNPDNFPYWQKDVVKFEVIDKKPGEVGSIGRLHYSQNGKRSYIMDDELIFCEYGKRYISKVSGDIITAQVDTELQTVDNNTEMKVTWKGTGKQLFIKLLLPFMRSKMINQSKTELETFKKLVETRGADFSA